MIAPGHVLFLWRVIHQHFTLAFFEHISSCRRDKPPWSGFMGHLLWPKVRSCPLELFRRETATTHNRTAFSSFGRFSCWTNKKIIQEDFAENSLFLDGTAGIRGGFLSWRSPFREPSACVWCVFTHARPPGPATVAPPRDRTVAYKVAEEEGSVEPRIHVVTLLYSESVGKKKEMFGSLELICINRWTRVVFEWHIER